VRRPALSSRAVAAGLSAIVLAGCGSEAEQLGPDELVSRADALCREGQESFAQIQSQPPSNSAEALDQTEELVSIAEDELNELRTLRPTEELRAPYDAYLAARGRAVEVMKEGLDAARAGDADGYTEAQARVSADSGKRAKLAAAAGLAACSKQPG
jgi:hypothetical protein